MAVVWIALLLAAPKVDALVAEYFAAGDMRRQEILRELEPVDRLEPAEVEAWRARLLKLAAKGRKLRKTGRNWFYDAKEKRGKYIVKGGRGTGGLVIGLHGGGKGAGDAGSAASTFGAIAARFKCVGIFPEVLEKTERGWTDSGTEEFVLELIEAAKRTWKIDPDRVYIVGHSMGGFGSWTIGAHHADLFAGIGPYAGAPVPITVDGGPRSEVVGIADGVIPNLRNVALHVYQSLDDLNVPPQPNIFANKTVLEWKRDYGGFKHYRYVEVNGRGHGAPPGGHVKGFQYLYRFKREARPKRILWQPVLSYKRMFYWLYWPRPEPRVLVEARVAAPNEIDLDLGGASRSGFTVLLDDDLVDLSREVVIREAGEEVFRGKVPRTLSSMLITATEKYDARNVFPARVVLE